ncbi:hypothetical protein EDD91_1334 [Streptomyces sp. KS 21]|nr:hypothetical protein EDD91_1334 [Streptomyces sp. KS 21]
MATVSLRERIADVARLHALNARHSGREPKLSQEVAGIGIDHVWEQPSMSSGCHERNSAQQAVRRAALSPTTRPER